MSQDAYHKVHIPPATKPSGCPVDHEFTPFDADYLQNPYPQLEKLTDEQPTFFSEQLGYLVLTRLEDVQDPVFPVCEEAQKILSAEDYNPQAVMSNRQQPDHTRIRRYTRDGFNARRMKLLEPYIRETCETLIDNMLENGGPAEFVSALAHPLPGQVIFRFIGFPEADDEQLIYWTANRLAFTWGKPTPEKQVEIAENMLKYWRYCRDFVAMRNEQPNCWRHTRPIPRT
jgi:cytochrome P450